MKKFSTSNEIEISQDIKNKRCDRRVIAPENFQYTQKERDLLSEQLKIKRSK